jgi:hypothetical protein
VADDDRPHPCSVQEGLDTEKEAKVDQDMKSMMENFRPGEPIAFNATLQLKTNTVEGVVATSALSSAEVANLIGKDAVKVEGKPAEGEKEAVFFAEPADPKAVAKASKKAAKAAKAAPKADVEADPWK